MEIGTQFSLMPEKRDGTITTYGPVYVTRTKLPSEARFGTPLRLHYVLHDAVTGVQSPVKSHFRTPTRVTDTRVPLDKT